MDPSNEPRRLSRRAALFWTGVAAIGLALAWIPLRPWYEVERYTRLREHDMRRNREAFEALVPQLEHRTAPAVIVSEIVGLEPTDPEPFTAGFRRVRMRTPEALFETLRGEAAASGYSVLVVDGAGRTDGGFSPHPEVETIADVPELTDYLREGESTWVRLRLAQLLVDRPDEPLFVWTRWTELTPPVVRRTRMRNSTARMSELRAVGEFTGSVGALSQYPSCRVLTLGLRQGDMVHAQQPLPRPIEFMIEHTGDPLEADALARALFTSE